MHHARAGAHEEGFVMAEIIRMSSLWLSTMSRASTSEDPISCQNEGHFVGCSITRSQAQVREKFMLDSSASNCTYLLPPEMQLSPGFDELDRTIDVPMIQRKMERCTACK